MKEERDQVLGHADESDGIEEYDNPLPDWWVGLFLFCIIWAGVYALHYHVIAGRSQLAYYEAELAAAEQQWPTVEATASSDAATLAAGAEIYTANCVGCHGVNLEGGIGPNLTDAEWIHGATFDAMVHTVTVGVLDKGMLAWGPILGPQKIGQVVSYIQSKEGTAPASAPVPTTPPAPVPPEQLTGTPEERGFTVFTTNCVACHGANLKGGVGPDLTDAEWIHGGTTADMKRTILEGVPAKGMISWRPILSEQQIDDVIAYVQSMNEAGGG